MTASSKPRRPVVAAREPSPPPRRAKWQKAKFRTMRALARPSRLLVRGLVLVRGLGRAGLDGPTCLLPTLEAAQNVRHGLEPHVLRRLGGERRAQTASAEEHELLVLPERLLVVGAFGIDPEFQHATRHIEGAGHLAVA